MKALVSFLLFATASTASADWNNQPICRDQLLNLLGIDSAQSGIDTTKQFGGAVTKSNINKFLGGLQVGDSCVLNLRIYQAASSGEGFLSVKDSQYIFNPFNHAVNFDNEQATCAGSGLTSAEGESYFVQDWGWHHSFGTQFSLAKNTDGSLTVRYRTYGTGDADRSVTCIGSIK